MLHLIALRSTIKAAVIAGLISAIVVVAKSNVQQLSQLTDGPMVGVAEVVVQRADMIHHLTSDNSVYGK